MGEDLWGWIAPVIVYILDHITLVGAVLLFLLQAIYQLYKIKICRRELYIKEKECKIKDAQDG